MKSTFTKLKRILFASMLLLGATSLMAQNVINVPSQVAGIREAFDLIVASPETYPTETPVIIRVQGEGYTVGYNPEGALVQNYLATAQVRIVDRYYDITIEGDGPEKTVIKGYASAEDMPEIRFGGHHNEGMRFLQIGSAGGAGMKLTLKNIKFQNWGFGNTNGGVINMNQGSVNGWQLSMVNVEFEHMMARAGAIVQSNQPNNDLHMDNVFVHNCVVYENNSFEGLFNLVRIRNLSVKNSTFMSNERYSINIGADRTGNDLARSRGTIFWIRAANQADDNRTILFENNAFVNNLPVEQTSWVTIVPGDVTINPTSTEATQPVISFHHEGEEAITTLIDVTMRNNIMIENKREGENMDVDVAILDPIANDRIVIHYPEEGNYNILNAIAKNAEFMEAAAIPYWRFENVAFDGYKVSREYTYTHADIAFEMEGDLPKVFYDEFGVGFVTYTGDGGTPGNPVTSITLSASSAFVAPGSTLQISATVEPTDADDTSVTWSVEYGTGIALIDQSGLLTGVSNGTVTVIATANDGSGVTGTLVITVGDDTSVTDPFAPRLTVYPNPVRGMMHIVSDVVIDEVRLINVIGQVVLSQEVNDKYLQLPTDNLKEGVYLVQIAAGNTVQMKRVVISR